MIKVITSNTIEADGAYVINLIKQDLINRGIQGASSLAPVDFKFCFFAGSEWRGLSGIKLSVAFDKASSVLDDEED